MRYLCLVYYDEESLDALGGSEMAALVSAAPGGRYLVSGALHSVQTATTIRIRNGRVTTADGPFAETTEQLGGFVVIQADDLNDALRVARAIPPVRLGCVEVRPIRALA